MVSKLNLSKRDKVLIVIGLIIIGILLIVLLVVVRGVSKSRDEAKNLAVGSKTPVSAVVSATSTETTTATATAKASKTPTATPTTVPTEDPSKDLNSAKAVASNFLDAYIRRNLEQAKPYMTDAFYQSYDQESFAGVSSPSRDRYEIVNAEAVKQGYVYSVKAYLYFKLNGEDVTTDVLQMDVVKDATKFLVSAMTENNK